MTLSLSECVMGSGNHRKDHVLADGRGDESAAQPTFGGTERSARPWRWQRRGGVVENCDLDHPYVVLLRRWHRAPGGLLLRLAPWPPRLCFAERGGRAPRQP